jgi:hypothetical protein
MLLHMPPHFDVPAIIEVASHGAPAFRGGTLSFQHFGPGSSLRSLTPVHPLSGSGGPNAELRPDSGSGGPNAEKRPLSGSGGPNAETGPLSGSGGPNSENGPPGTGG